MVETKIKNGHKTHTSFMYILMVYFQFLTGHRSEKNNIIEIGKILGANVTTKLKLLSIAM